MQTTRIYLMGFSEGGSVADLAAVTMSDAFHAAAIYAGALPGKASLLPAPRLIPVRLLVGTADSFLDGARDSRDEWMAAGHTVLLDEVAGAGHSVAELEADGPGFGAVFAWMRDADVAPAPSRFPR